MSGGKGKQITLRGDPLWACFNASVPEDLLDIEFVSCDSEWPDETSESFMPDPLDFGKEEVLDTVLVEEEEIERLDRGRTTGEDRTLDILELIFFYLPESTMGDMQSFLPYIIRCLTGRQDSHYPTEEVVNAAREVAKERGSVYGLVGILKMYYMCVLNGFPVTSPFKRCAREMVDGFTYRMCTTKEQAEKLNTFFYLLATTTTAASPRQLA